MDRVSSSRKARATGERRIVLHATEAWLAIIESNEHPIFNQIEKALATHSIPMQLAELGSRTAKDVLQDPDTGHILLGATAQFGPNILHLSRAPIWGFWHLDELGAGWQSSLRLSEFDASTIDNDRAEYFFNGVTGYMLRENVSLTTQETRMHGTLQGAKATVFCQAIDADNAKARYLSTEDMIRTAATFDPEALVYVKLAEDHDKEDRRAIMAVTQDYTNVRLSEASVHDLVEASDLVITHSAPAGFEALMQRCPVITCAKSQYWQASLTTKSVADLREALEYGTLAMLDFPYDKYLYWTLVKHGFEPAKNVFAKRISARIFDKLMWH